MCAVKFSQKEITWCYLKMTSSVSNLKRRENYEWALVAVNFLVFEGMLACIKQDPKGKDDTSMTSYMTKIIETNRKFGVININDGCMLKWDISLSRVTMFLLSLIFEYLVFPFLESLEFSCFVDAWFNPSSYFNMSLHIHLRYVVFIQNCFPRRSDRGGLAPEYLDLNSVMVLFS